MAASVHRLRMVDNPKPPQDPNRDERWLWRQAVVLVGQLPEGEADARAVLCFAKQILNEAPKPTRA